MSDELPVSPETLAELIDALTQAYHAADHIADVTGLANRSLYIRSEAMKSDLRSFLRDVGGPDPEDDCLPGFESMGADLVNAIADGRTPDVEDVLLPHSEWITGVALARLSGVQVLAN